jgi:hypothetical protein
VRAAAASDFCKQPLQPIPFSIICNMIMTYKSNYKDTKKKVTVNQITVKLQ